MQNPADLPRTARPRRVSDRGRAFIIIAAVVVVGLLLSARFLAGFYTEYLWYESVDRGDVFWGEIGSKATLFVMFGVTFAVLAILNLIIADRLAPAAFSANTHPVVERFHEFFGSRLRILRFGVAGLFALMFAAPAVARWQDWLMFRNSKSFGIADAQFGNDVGFYMFKLPFVTFVLDWMFLALAFVTVLVLATHVLSGGIVLQPPRPKVRRATKAHLAVLLALLALLKAADYWVMRYELTNANRGSFTGPNYTVVNAQLPAVLLLGLIAVFTAGLYLSSLKTDKWRPAVIASALWAIVALVGGVIYPAVIQSLVVNPNKKDKEATFIAHNIEATRQALGIGDVEVQQVKFDPITTTKVENQVAALRDVRLIKPDEKMETRFRTDEGRPGSTIADLDPDRYVVDGRAQQVIVGARELDLSQVGNKSWQGTHLINTHGCGLAMALAAQIQSDGKPVYRDDVVDVTKPQLYFSPTLDGYSVVSTSVPEQPCEGFEDSKPYSGVAGVQLNSGLRRLAFALAEFDYNLVGSSAIGDQSRFVSVRNVRERAQKAAPFLSYDGDPYPVVLDGRVMWVVDAYTTSSRYPYGQFADQTQVIPGSGLDHTFNYVRNSVKAVVDAYDGTVTLYAVDDTDPVLQVWRSAFPDLFTPMAKMPAGLKEHLRYPEELFRVQTAAYSKYRLDANDFFDRRGAWSVALAATAEPGGSGVAGGTLTTTATGAPNDFAGESDAARFVPYYTMFHPSGEENATFELYRPFQPFSTTDQRKELIAYMTASSDPATYGKLVAWELPASALPDGPNTIGAAMATDPQVSETITLLGQQGSAVAFGDLQMIPVAGGVVWIAPLYVESDTAGQPLLRRMVAYYDGKVAIGTDIASSLNQLFPGFDAEIGDVSGTTPDGPVDPGKPPTQDQTAQQLLDEAQQLFDQADVALRAGDLGTYADKVAQARDLVAQALALLNAANPDTSTT
ncbi:MAG: UPF0182 family protein, partial [Ilumatobacteraceae bacterium]